MSATGWRTGCCIDSWAGARSEQQSPIADLTDRELEVFRLIGEGHGTRQIAEELHISVKTVESYQAHIKEKLSLKNARELVQRAIQWTVAEQTRPEIPSRDAQLHRSLTSVSGNP